MEVPMRGQIALLSLALLAATPAGAQQQPAEHDQHHPAEVAQQQTTPTPQPRPGGPGAMRAPGAMGGQGMMGGSGMMMGGPGMMMGGPGMMGMMGGGMGMGGMMSPERIEGRLAFLKTELKITDAQMGAWNGFADALRANAKEMQGEHATMMQTMQQGAGMTAPQVLELREQHLSRHLDALKRMHTALAPLYAALSDEQKKTADQLLGHGMM
jgi:hypothetical protein